MRSKRVVQLLLPLALRVSTAMAQVGAVASSAPENIAGAAGVSPATPPSGSRTAEKYHEEGVSALRAHQLDAAVNLLRQAVALDAKSALYVTDLGYAYLIQRRLVDAESAFKQGIVLDPLRPHAYEHLEQSITQQAERWGKRQELFRILEQGLFANKLAEARFRLEVAKIRAERAFGLMDQAKRHIERLLAQPEVPPGVARQLRNLRSSIEQDKKANALRDWPEPTIESKALERFAECERYADPHRRKTALVALLELLTRYPAWRAPRALRATILTEQGHYDEAVKELTVLTRLAPSNANYQRQLGMLLAAHGGLLELERADEALRNALALEPEWQELEQLRQQLAGRRYDPNTHHRPASTTAPRPTENAIRLYNEAESKLDEDPFDQAGARQALEQALRESPGYVEAAAMLYSIERHIPEVTVRTLWNDASGLYALYQEFSRTKAPPDAPVLESWLDRAVGLGNVDARLARALFKKSRGDMAGAELELSNYLALIPNSGETEAVQLLRAELGDKRQKPDPLADAILNARLRLQKEDSDGALRTLDAPCRIGMDSDRLLMLGIVYERMGKHAEALDCYELQFGKQVESGSTLPIARRAARLFARGEPKLFQHPATARLGALAAMEPAALWALARVAMHAGKLDEASGFAAQYLAKANATDRFVDEAKSLQAQLRKQAKLEQEQLSRRHRIVRGIAAALAGLMGLLGFLAMFRGRTVARAIRLRPRLYPEVSRVIGELKHDVLKHRTSALALLRNDGTTVEKLRRTMLEPVASSTVVADAYARLVSSARAEGLTLRRLEREPVFGRFVKDLRQVEHALMGGFDRSVILDVDERLRGIHRERLAHLVSLGPTCRLDASEMQRWIAAIEAECDGRRIVWTVPALQISDPVLHFPVDQPALFQLFSNIMRNAQVAVTGVEEPRLLVSLSRSTDFSGQPLVRLQVSDNGATELTYEHVAAQPPGRGLGIIRDTTRDWLGRVVIAPASTPFVKSVGVEFDG